jgi:hypothetical protein
MMRSVVVSLLLTLSVWIRNRAAVLIENSVLIERIDVATRRRIGLPRDGRPNLASPHDVERGKAPCPEQVDSARSFLEWNDITGVC